MIPLKILTPFLATFPYWTTAHVTLRGMSWNLRWDSQADNVTIEQSLAALNGNSIQTPTSYYPNTNERPWSQRRIPVSELVLHEGVSFMGPLEIFYYYNNFFIFTHP